MYTSVYIYMHIQVHTYIYIFFINKYIYIYIHIYAYMCLRRIYIIMLTPWVELPGCGFHPELPILVGIPGCRQGARALLLFLVLLAVPDDVVQAALAGVLPELLEVRCLAGFLHALQELLPETEFFWAVFSHMYMYIHKYI